MCLPLLTGWSIETVPCTRMGRFFLVDVESLCLCLLYHEGMIYTRKSSAFLGLFDYFTCGHFDVDSGVILFYNIIWMHFRIDHKLNNFFF